MQKPVRILNSHLELYAPPAFMGALATALILRLRPAQANAALAVGFFVVSCGRVLAVTRHLRYPTMVQTRDDLEESRSLFLMRVSSEISAKLALIALPDDDGMRSPGSRARTLSV